MSVKIKKELVDRRQFIRACATMVLSGSLSGCGYFRRPSLPDSGFAIDTHCHIFNARDLPIRSFAEHVILEGEAGELRAVLLAFQKALQVNAPDFPAEKELLLELIDGVESAFDLLEDTEAPAGLAEEVLDEIRQTDPAAYEELLLDLDIEPGLEADGSLLGTVVERAVNWGFLMTRYRTQIAAKLAKTYDEVALFTPALVDFDLWLDADEDVKTPIGEQVELYGLLSEWSQGRFHGFVAFDPFRELQNPEGEGGTLKQVQRAVNEHGFIGVKLYPPMGFRAIGNSELWPQNDIRKDLDGPLADLFSWCQAEGVPILAHCNETNESQTGFAERASPEYWGDALQEFPNLRLCLGHFGGISKVQQSPSTSWARMIGELMELYPNVYADTGFHTTALDADDSEIESYMAGIDWLLQEFPVIRQRLVYGSDWQMILIKEGHADYLDRYREQISQRFGNVLADDFVQENARRYLGIDQPGGNRDRLLEFYSRRNMETPGWWRS